MFQQKTLSKSFSEHFFKIKRKSKSLWTFLLTPLKLYIFSVIALHTTLYDCKLYNIICSLFWFVIVFYIFLYVPKNSAQFSLNTKAKTFPIEKYMHHVICTLCIISTSMKLDACMHVYTRTRTPFSILCYIIQSFRFIFRFQTDNRHTPYENMHTNIRWEKALLITHTSWGFLLLLME